MGEVTEYERMAEESEEGYVVEWKMGLPSAEDLTPLSQPMIPRELASAFSIAPEPARTMLDVHRASQNTVSSLRHHAAASSSSPLKSFAPFPEDPMVPEPNGPFNNDGAPGEPSRKARRPDAAEEAGSSEPQPHGSNDDDSARTLKRPRLVWTPQLHKRFVEVVAHLGIKNAVPKTIMQLMNVEGLSRENVASHLQKYRLYLKRMQGLSNEGSSSSDQLFASTPVPQSLHQHHEHHHHQQPMPYAMPTMIPMPMFGMPHLHG